MKTYIYLVQVVIRLATGGAREPLRSSPADLASSASPQLGWQPCGEADLRGCTFIQFYELSITKSRLNEKAGLHEQTDLVELCTTHCTTSRKHLVFFFLLRKPNEDWLIDCYHKFFESDTSGRGGSAVSVLFSKVFFRRCWAGSQ